MHLAAKFVEAEVKELLKNEYSELTPYEKSVYVAIACKIIAAYEEYRYLMEGKKPATLNMD